MISIKEAIEKIEWYQNRWKIEEFHKILKSGLKSESLRFQTAQRLINAISIFCILSWRIFWMTIMNRIAPNGSSELILTHNEIDFFNVHYKLEKHNNNTLSQYIQKIAILGGYLARKNDPPPGNLVIWRSMQKLNDILYGYQIAKDETKNTILKEIYENYGLNILMDNC